MSEWKGPWRCDDCGLELSLSCKSAVERGWHYPEEEIRRECRGYMRPFDRRAPSPAVELVRELREELRHAPGCPRILDVLDSTCTCGASALGARTDIFLETVASAGNGERSSGAEVARSQGALDVLTERQRQIEQEGWTAEHDAKWRMNQLIRAAICYLLPDLVVEHWPWDAEWWKPKDRRRNLVRAAALIIAELDRMDCCYPGGTPGEDTQDAAREGGEG